MGEFRAGLIGSEDFQKPGRPPMTKSKPVDPLRSMIDRLKVEGTLNDEYRENMNMDWRTENKLLSEAITKTTSQRAWLPRLGEIVLYVRDLQGEICRDDDSKSYRVFDLGKNEFVGDPLWEAGVVSQVPEEDVQLQDILGETEKQYNVTYSGFRVEPLPDPLRKNKRLSKQYKYIAAHHLRPFVFWSELLSAIPPAEWHSTIDHAITIQSSISLFGKHRFKGVWPTADLHCHGMYIGSELICIGDAVRLTPSTRATNSNVVTDVLHITTIKLHMTNLDKAGSDDADDGHPYNSTIQVFGKAYTVDPSRSWSAAPLTAQEMSQTLPQSMTTYQGWHPLHNPQLFFQIGFSRILSRLYEEEAMGLWFPAAAAPEEADHNSLFINGDGPSATSLQADHLSQGLPGLSRGRELSKARDTRMLPDKSFLWTSSRGETLDIATMNGISLSKYDVERDDEQLDIWKRAAKVLEKTAGQEDKDLVQVAELTKTLGTGAFSMAAVDLTSGQSDTAETRDEDVGPSAQLLSKTASGAAASSRDEAEEKTDLAARFGLKRGSEHPEAPESASDQKRLKRYPIVVVPARSPSVRSSSQGSTRLDNGNGSLHQEAGEMLVQFRAPEASLKS